MGFFPVSATEPNDCDCKLLNIKNIKKLKYNKTKKQMVGNSQFLRLELFMTLPLKTPIP